jgi:hypothetical protein
MKFAHVLDAQVSEIPIEFPLNMFSTGRGGPWGCETSRLTHFLGNRLTDGGKFVSLTHRPPFTS